MKQKLFIFLGLLILIVVLIGLNAASYTQKEKVTDTEMYPNRSTYNSGATGTRAFFELLAETGRKPVRWVEPPDKLLNSGAETPSTFVVIGELKLDYSEEAAAAVLKWVSEGGKLVIIDREPPKSLVNTTANWRVSFAENYLWPTITTDPADQNQMTAGMKAAKPVQPSVYTTGVNAVQISQFASSVNFERLPNAEIQEKTGAVLSQPPRVAPSSPEDEDAAPVESAGIGSGRGTGIGNADTTITARSAPVYAEEADEEVEEVETPAITAPVVYLSDERRNLLVDVPYGLGRIVFLTDPYIVANGGINLVDNAQLAVNVVAASGGTIAFDEYHQGFGTDRNRFLQFFAGTPVVAIFLQLALLVGLLFFSQSRRFARALPEREPDRLSKLEYVAAMAQLQQRTKAFDLAVENIYTEFRRRTSRLFGVDNFTVTRRELAGLIAERAKLDRNDVEDLMFKCEEIIHGEPTGKKEVLQITGRLREIEEKLGLQRRKMERRTRI